MYGRRQQNGGYPQTNRRSGGSGRFKVMLMIGLAMAAFQAFKYFTNVQVNPVTGESQRVQWTVDEETQLGLQSREQMAAQHGGLHRSTQDRDFVKRVGEKLANHPEVRKSGYSFDFHLLADERVVNAFALPGGQCFITAALYGRLQNEDQLAGVLGHEIGHVIHRHGAERMAKSGFIQGLIQSVMIGSGGDAGMTQIAGMIGNYTNMKYGRDQELESDQWGLGVMIDAGYDPYQMIEVMNILEEASGGGGNTPEFQSTHPSPENRRQKIKEFIEKYRGN